MGDAKKQEHDLLAEGMPPLNNPGAVAGDGDSLINRAVKAQLTLVCLEAAAYVKTEGRGYGEGQMPHEWGSMDTYDDMRNSLRGASVLMEELLDVGDEAEQLDVVRRSVDESGVCATAVRDLAYPGTEEEKGKEEEAWQKEQKDYGLQYLLNRQMRDAIRNMPVADAERLAVYTEEVRLREQEEHEEIMAKMEKGEL